MKWRRNSTQRALVRVANQARDAGNWAYAAEGYRAILAVDPFNDAIWVQYGNVLKELGDPARAERMYQIALEDSPNTADTYVQLGHVLKLLGRADDMAQAYRHALAIDPSLRAAQQELGRLEAVEPDSSRDRASSLVTTPSRYVAFRRKRNPVTLGDRAMLLGRWEQATEFYHAVLVKKPGNVAILVQYGHALREAGRLAEAISAYDAAFVGGSQDPEAKLQKGCVLRRLSFLRDSGVSHQEIAVIVPGITETQSFNQAQQHAVETKESLQGKNNYAGDTLGRDASALIEPAVLAGEFDAKWYLSYYTDVALLRNDPFEHYLRHGVHEGRFPNASAWTQSLTARLDCDWYLGHYPDLALAGSDPLEHYLRHGVHEGRFPNASEWTQSLTARLDCDWYLGHYPDLALAGSDPLEHYLRHGVHEGRFPNASEWTQSLTARLDCDWYLGHYPDLALAGSDPLEHYLRHGVHEGRFPNASEWTQSLTARLDCDWYLGHYPDLALAGSDPLEHYLRHGVHEGRFPNASEWTQSLTARLDCDWYLGHYPDLALAGSDPLEHYLRHGVHEGRFPNASEWTQSLTARLDCDWYLGHYPDLALAGSDPLEHYLRHGVHEGRFPNASEWTQSLTARLDCDWYLSHYPDLALAGSDPLEHYSNYGWIEGRAPNEEALKQAFAQELDPAWYLSQSPDIVAAGVEPLVHFLECGFEEGRPPNEKRYWENLAKTFDAAWYLKRNQDVAASGGDPFEHYVNYGIRERRRPNQETNLASIPVENAHLECLKHPTLPQREVALFVTFSPTGQLKAHVKHYLASLQRQHISTVLIVTTDQPFTDADAALVELVDGLFVRQNQGFDFAAWAQVLRSNPALYDSTILYLINDSVFGPFSDAMFCDMLEKIRRSSGDFLGLTENSERNRHLQSYFFACKASVLASAVFRNFVDGVVSFHYKDDVVNEYETRLTEILSEAGLRCEPVFPLSNAAGPTLFHWKRLIGMGFPFLKVSTAQVAVPGVEKSDWRDVLRDRGYDVALADRTLGQLAASTHIPVHTLQDAKKKFRMQCLAELHDFFASGELLSMPAAASPEVTILIVVYNEAELTLRCLRSVVETVDIPAEVIIVDNASSDDTSYLFEQVQGARILRNVEDLHFLRAANQGAARASGRTLLLINNDACLTAGALQYGLETINSGSDIGAVGAKLILPNGLLQEAGSIIWSDAACLGYGRGCEPTMSDFQFRREVDYCSGAYMLLRRDLFEHLGRFEAAFAPAYYEETDLCMRIRDAGYRIMYDPRIEVHHYEFASASSSTEASFLMTRNRSLFTHRNAAALAKRHLSSNTNVLFARASDRWRPRVLMIENMLPFGYIGAGFPRADKILRSLVEAGYFVTYYPTHQAQASWEEIHATFPIDVEFILGPNRPSLDQFLQDRSGYYSGMLVCRPNNMEFIASDLAIHPERYTGVAIIYDAEAVTSPREVTRLALAGTPLNPRDEQAALQAEMDLACSADAVVAVNRREADLFAQAGHENVHVLGHTIKLDPTELDISARRDFLLVGALMNDLMPNVDSLIWFVDKVMPKLDLLIGTRYRLYVAGTLGAERLKKSLHSRVILLGRVDDLSDYYQRSRIFIAPTRYAAGIPLKIYEAASRGVPVVATNLLASQLSWQVGAELLTGDTPDDFAAACANLYSDDSLWERLRNASLERVALDCDPAGFECELLDILRSVRVFPVSSKLEGRLNKSIFNRSALLSDVDETRPGKTTQDHSMGSSSSTEAVLTVSTNTRLDLVEPKLASSVVLQNATVSVIYLAYGGTTSSLASFKRFLASYTEFPAGLDHSFYVAFKAFPSVAELAHAESLFTSAGAKLVYVEDQGLDLQSYLDAAQKVGGQQVCFLNTNSEILVTGWLEKMAAHLRRPEVGMVGATGSFESLSHPSIAFPKFPNPNLRTNAFMLDNKLFQSVLSDTPLLTKEDAWLNESGPNSLTRKILARGLDVLIVGRNGRAYPQRWWPCSDTFRQGEQSNLLVADNRTRDFQDGSNDMRRMLMRLAWGAYLDSNDALVSEESGAQIMAV